MFDRAVARPPEEGCVEPGDANEAPPLLNTGAETVGLTAPDTRDQDGRDANQGGAFAPLAPGCRSAAPTASGEASRTQLTALTDSASSPSAGRPAVTITHPVPLQTLGRLTYAGIDPGACFEGDLARGESPQDPFIDSRAVVADEPPPSERKPVPDIVQQFRSLEPHAVDPNLAAVGESTDTRGSVTAAARRAITEFVGDAAPRLRARAGFEAVVSQAGAVSIQPAETSSRITAMQEAAAAERPGSVLPPQVAETVNSQIVRAVTLSWRDGVGEATVRLEPGSLGTVTVALKVERGIVTATVVSDVAAVRDSLNLHERDLRAALASHGLELDQLIVTADPDTDRRQQSSSGGSAWRRLPRHDPARRFELDA